MKNIDEKIARSQAQWRRYRYENMGVRESMGHLCRALEKSTKKRLNCAAVNLRAGMKASGFEPSYDEKRENIVVSLTSTQGRIKYIFPTLNSLMSQSLRADLIVLWLDSAASYPQSVIAGIEAMGILIKYREDLGPHTKYHYAFSEYKNDLVITVDDDIIYHRDMIKELYETYPEYPDQVIARRVHKIRFGYDRKPVRYRDWIWEYRSDGKPAVDLFATGCGGVLYPPAVMAQKCWENMDFRRICPGADDIWLKFCELYNGTLVCGVKGAGFDKDAPNLRMPGRGLSAANVDRGRNDRYIRSCAKYFGNGDDLCEMILKDR